MKFYNPFKPHIIEISGKFYIRKYSIHVMTFLYLSNSDNDDYWYGSKDLWTSFGDLLSAESRMKNQEFSRVKVHI